MTNFTPFDTFFREAQELTSLGASSSDTDCFRKADELFSKAEAICPVGNNPLENTAIVNLYWQWGLSWSGLHQVSGEALDLQCALKKFQKVLPFDCREATFWRDYGDATLQLGRLINDQAFFFQAVNSYEKSCKFDPTNAQGWYHLAAVSRELYALSALQEHLNRAIASFEKLEAINRDSKFQDTEVWVEWSRLLIEAGRQTHDWKFLEEALEKLIIAEGHRAADGSFDDSLAACRAEALLLLGSSTEQLDLIKQAEALALEVLKMDPENPEYWCLYSNCLNELGYYFDELDYYQRAIDRFEYAISLDSSSHWAWYGLSLSYFLIGDAEGSIEWISKAEFACHQAVILQGTFYPQFWNRWGECLLKKGELTYESASLELAVEKFEQSIAMRGGLQGCGEVEWLYNLGCALDFLGDFHDSEETYIRAVEVLKVAVELDPTFFEGRHALAVSMTHLGELSADIDCFHKAIALFETLAGEQEENEQLWNDWGFTLLHLSQLLVDPSQPNLGQDFIRQAEQKLLRGASLGSTEVYYTLVCLYSLTGHCNAAMHFLRKAEVSDALPPLDEMMIDPWLDTLRTTILFRRFFDALKLSLGYIDEQP